MNVKRSVALAIRDDAQPGRLLLVRRPDDDEDLPGVWGLPAASLRGGEDWEGAALRAGREKLGVALEIGRTVNQGSKQRAGYRLDMRLVAARIGSGTPAVGGPVTAGTTRYQDWRWGSLSELEPAAERGSLCSRLALEAFGSA